MARVYLCMYRESMGARWVPSPVCRYGVMLVSLWCDVGYRCYRRNQVFYLSGECEDCGAFVRSQCALHQMEGEGMCGKLHSALWAIVESRHKRRRKEVQ